MTSATDFPELLRKAGYKATPGRVALLKLLKASKEPVSIQEILKKAGKVAGDQATVYRILEVLEKIGAVKQVNLRHGHTDYEFTDPKDHHHLVCIKCKKVEDFTGCGTEEVAARALKQVKSFSKITQHSLEFFGICKKCI